MKQLKQLFLQNLKKNNIFKPSIIQIKQEVFLLNLGRIWDFIAEKNIEPQDILELVEEVKKVDTSDEENLRRIIKKVSILARKNISLEQENKLIAKIQTDGIDFSLLEYF